jgi:hypothetical protein
MEFNVDPDDCWLIIAMAYFMSSLWRGLAFTVLWNVIVIHIINCTSPIGFIRGLGCMILFDLAFKLKVRFKK